jgi:hypothetical protein
MMPRSLSKRTLVPRKALRIWDSVLPTPRPSGVRSTGLLIQISATRPEGLGSVSVGSASTHSGGTNCGTRNPTYMSGSMKLSRPSGQRRRSLSNVTPVEIGPTES